MGEDRCICGVAVESHGNISCVGGLVAQLAATQRELASTQAQLAAARDERDEALMSANDAYGELAVAIGERNQAQQALREAERHREADCARVEAMRAERDYAAHQWHIEAYRGGVARRFARAWKRAARVWWKPKVENARLVSRLHGQLAAERARREEAEANGEGFRQSIYALESRVGQLRAALEQAQRTIEDHDIDWSRANESFNELITSVQLDIERALAEPTAPMGEESPDETAEGARRPCEPGEHVWAPDVLKRHWACVFCGKKRGFDGADEPTPEKGRGTP